MSFKSYIVPRIAAKILSEDTLLANRRKVERRRKRAREPHCVEFFHDCADPYSQLLQKVLPQFQNKYKVQLQTHLVSPPNNSAAPEREKLKAYSKIDALRLAQKLGIDFTVQDTQAATNTDAADKRRKALGHYSGGMLYYGGEWYWGLDRLHFLEARLTDLGLSQNSASPAPLFPLPSVPLGHGNTGVELHWYLSLRSPYTAIIRDHVKFLATAYGATLKLRFVLPMVMRGLPVPPAKKAYIPLDAAREARRLGVAFGKVMDPVGKPVEMGYSLLPWAEQQGRGYEYVQSWLSAVWAEGIDAGSHKGLKKIVTRVGLEWDVARTVLGNEDWRIEAETNRAEMMDRGIWGVPSFRVGETITWGQDRLWVIEDALKALSKDQTKPV